METENKLLEIISSFGSTESECREKASLIISKYISDNHIDLESDIGKALRYCCAILLKSTE